MDQQKIRRTSRFRGVVQVRSGRWGAYVTVNGKQVWLGTYDVEEHAALAYDRANQKLQRAHMLNFPLATRVAQEMQFQDSHPLESIITMIRAGTYQQKFNAFIRSGHQRVGNATRGSAAPVANNPVMLFGVRIG